MSDDLWGTDRLDLPAYLERIGRTEPPGPSREALEELYDAHLRTFTFDNIDVLLDQHPGVDLPDVQAKFVGRGRGGYCFEHGTLFAAVLDRLGYAVERRLARVGDPTAAGRTHLVAAVDLGGERLLADPGFGLSVWRPIPLVDGAVDEMGGITHRVRRGEFGWALERAKGDGWELMHTHDEALVVPVDVAIGHHYTSTHPTVHFRHRLITTKLLADRHVSLTHNTVTIRREGQETEHREIGLDEVMAYLEELEVPLTDDERVRLRERLASLD
ncbi:N-hydroxyarylamine O-acetyltransferase [Nocardioides luteus]|uniref:Arylamine N-acetyltransferase n=1 Tax=Nocardioides luteus TaxID=1844 RepID=A0ABQ5T1S9_9ACTN|nr:arylamine N-acetyltransferase [Nocardioides luteus]MDR7310771.1 N-hydroxyarylamine O-acetyltransferase [Nocardioides luteus]GGR40723.1 arylamine N-acetyltransferase [Nocardioides luteus]GLJ69449.1 arylamine N-acetyltransferase [Nocardioides luteus]